MTIRVTGTGLLSLVSDVGGDNKQRLITMAGYFRPDGRLAYTDFYEALIKAKNIPTVSDDGSSDLTEEEQELWDHACNCMGNMDDDEMERIWDDLTDLCSTPDEFDEIYQGSYDGWNPDEDFARDFMDGMGDMSEDHLLYAYVDWQAFYDGCLRYDCTKLESRYSSHYFRNI